MHEVMLRSIAFYNNLLMETFISTRIHVCAFPEGPAMFSDNRINGTSSSESDESALVCFVVFATCGGGEGGGSSLSSLSESTGFRAFFRVLGGMRPFLPFLKS